MTHDDILLVLDSLFILQGSGIQPDPATLARRAGTTPDTAGRVLAHLTRRGLVDDRARLTMNGLAAAVMLRGRHRARLRAA